MPIEWTEDLKTDILSIDIQHKELFKMTNELLEACKQGKGAKEVDKVIAFLDKYVKTHFETEEKYMVEYNFNGYDYHKLQHDLFVKKSRRF